MRFSYFLIVLTFRLKIKSNTFKIQITHFKYYLYSLFEYRAVDKALLSLRVLCLINKGVIFPWRIQFSSVTKFIHDRRIKIWHLR